MTEVAGRMRDMSRHFWIGTGWKMNKTVAEARAYISELVRILPPMCRDLSVFIIPPFTALEAARAQLGAECPVLLGAQNMHWEEEGAFTGEISARMLKEFGVDLVELGHSERRATFGETDETVNLKVKTVLRHGMKPLVCVGDTMPEYRAGASVETVLRQVKMAFSGLDSGQLANCMVAYEPVWAIGEGGIPATPEHVAGVHAAVRRVLAERADAFVPILYGGSVNPQNAGELSREPEVDGLFVGRSAWSAQGLADIVRLLIEAKFS